jgi:hypothetical protein
MKTLKLTTDTLFLLNETSTMVNSFTLLKMLLRKLPLKEVYTLKNLSKIYSEN